MNIIAKLDQLLKWLFATPIRKAVMGALLYIALILPLLYGARPGRFSTDFPKDIPLILLGAFLGGIVIYIGAKRQERNTPTLSPQQTTPAKQPTYFAVITWIALIALVCVVGFNLFALLSKRPHQPQPVYSPSGEQVILPSINTDQDDMTQYLCVKLVIQDVGTGTTLFEIQTGASSRMRWSVGWIGEDMIQLKSSDIGDRCWAEGNDGAWHDGECPPK